MYAFATKSWNCWVTLTLLVIEFKFWLRCRQIACTDCCGMWIMWRNVSAIVILLAAIGWRAQCQLLYRKWWIWWRTKYHAVSCCTQDSQLDEVMRISCLVASELLAYQSHNSAFYPSGVGKWVPALAEKAKAGMVHSVSGWMRGVQVKLRSLENACHTWAP